MSQQASLHRVTVPSVREICSVIPVEARTRSNALAIAIFVAVGGIYAISFCGMLVAGALWLKTAFACVNGLGITLLFVIGHDACHGSFARQSWLNQCLGRLAFLPSMYPFTCWELGHNRLHHCWTNFRPKDYVWVPTSPSEYNAMPVWRRCLERIWRHPLGLGLYCLVFIWWRHMMMPTRDELRKMPRWPCYGDRMLVMLWLAAQVILFTAASRDGEGLTMVFIGLVLPQAIWTWLFGAVTFLQHTNPRSRWFARQEEWSFYAGQVENTVHVILPPFINMVLMHITEHTAHHIDPTVPLYRLHDAQDVVRRSFANSIIAVKLSFRELWRICRVCQLYDYDSHCWMSFNGKPHSEGPLR